MLAAAAQHPVLSCRSRRTTGGIAITGEAVGQQGDAAAGQHQRADGGGEEANSTSRK
jgi:hypothetical protein